MNILVTGGAGFIGSHFVKMLFSGELGIKYSSITVLDKLTYAGKMKNLSPLVSERDFVFIHGDIADEKIVQQAIHGKEIVINFAAESHVDRSIESSISFLDSNVRGVGVLLEQSLKSNVKRFLQVSTDEVYGSISQGSWNEESPLDPNSPYAASKAAGDLLVQAFNRTHGLHTIITRCSNNYGENQDEEKLIPKVITSSINGTKIPVYGDGTNQREWIHVKDHCRGIATALNYGEAGNIYNIGSENNLKNIDLINLIIKLTGASIDQIQFVSDRKGHDLRYSLNYSKIKKLGFFPDVRFEEGIKATIDWYASRR